LRLGQVSLLRLLHQIGPTPGGALVDRLRNGELLFRGAGLCFSALQGGLCLLDLRLIQVRLNDK
jgi:hypothetical protein